MKTKLFVVAGVWALLGTTGTVFAQHQTGQSALLSTQAKIGLEQAERAALSAQPGITKDIELERTKLGQVVFSVTIAQGDKKVEVQVDPRNGKVLGVERD